MARGSRPAAADERIGVLASALQVTGKSLTWLLAALLFSIVIEMLGMIFWWPDQGVDHSTALLAQELTYLNDDFKRSLVTNDPEAFTRRVMNHAYQVLWQWTRLEGFLIWLSRQPQPDEQRWMTRLREYYQALAEFATAAVIISQLFAARLAVLLLAMPAFALFAVVGLSYGLAQRDVRRWGGGREHAFIYHHAKRWVVPLLIAAWVVYLGLPFSLHPSYVVLPFASLAAVAIAVAAATFKKYL